MPDDRTIYHFLGPFAFRVADKFFKFVSWALLVVVLRYAATETSGAAVKVLSHLAAAVFVGALLMQAFYTAVRSPASLGVPEHLHTVSRVIQIILGMALVALVGSPDLLLDQLLEELAKARTG